MFEVKDDEDDLVSDTSKLYALKRIFPKIISSYNFLRKFVIGLHSGRQKRGSIDCKHLHTGNLSALLRAYLRLNM